MPSQESYIAYQRVHQSQQRISITGDSIGSIIHQYIYIEPITYEIYHEREEIVLQVKGWNYTVIGQNFEELYRLLQHQKIEYLKQYIGTQYQEVGDANQPIITHIRREEILLQ
jgi:hypothetical protein